MPSWQTLDEFDFHPRLSAQPGWALVLFGQPGCSACRAWKARLPDMNPALDALYAVDVSVSSALAHEFELFHLPALALFRHGEFHGWLAAELSPPAIARELAAAKLRAPLEAP